MGTATRTVQLAREIDQLLRQSRLPPTRLKLLRAGLLSLLETGVAARELRTYAGRTRGSGLNTRLRELERLLRRDYALPRAIYSRHALGRPLRVALDDHGARQAEYAFVGRLAREVRRDLGDFACEQLTDIAWVAQTRAMHEQVTVVLETRAIEEMLLAALETYRVPVSVRVRVGSRRRMSRQPYTEVYGLCLGVRRVTEPSRPDGIRHVHVAVTTCVPQLRAKGNSGAVFPCFESTDVLVRAAQVLFRHLEVVGDFHSHPYRKPEVLVDYGYRYTPMDEEANKDFCKYLERSGHAPSIGLIVGIAPRNQKRPPRGPHAFGPNTWQLAIDGCQVILSAYRVLDDGTFRADGVHLHANTSLTARAIPRAQ